MNLRRGPRPTPPFLRRPTHPRFSLGAPGDLLSESRPVILLRRCPSLAGLALVRRLRRDRASITNTFAAMKANQTIGRAEALRRSMLALIATGGQSAHPAHWAPLIVVGEGGTSIPAHLTTTSNLAMRATKAHPKRSIGGPRFGGSSTLSYLTLTTDEWLFSRMTQAKGGNGETR